LTTTANSFEGRPNIPDDLQKRPGFNSRTHLLLHVLSEH
jgi:hypothetical protein